MKFNALLTDLLKIGDLYVMGGALREFRDGGCLANTRDLDIGVNIHREDLWLQLLQRYQHTLNHFDGCKFQCKDFTVDVWDVKNTWAFKQGHVDVSAGCVIPCEPHEYGVMRDYFGVEDWYNTFLRKMAEDTL